MSSSGGDLYAFTFISGIVFGGFIIGFSCAAVMSSDTRSWHAEAVSRGYAEYVVDEFGDTTWKWKEPSQ